MSEEEEEGRAEGTRPGLETMGRWRRKIGREIVGRS
jgi:hypothetical protein